MAVSSAVTAGRSLERDLRVLCSSIETFRVRNPGVEGCSRLLKRAQQELRFCSQLAEGSPSLLSALPENPGDRERALDAWTRGLDNNVRGLRAELEVADSAPGVVAVCKRFPLPQDGYEGGAATSKTWQSNGPWPKTVEVDVVAQKGHTWIDVKEVSTFSLSSKRWTGNDDDSIGGLERQAWLYLRAAQHPVNRLQWRPPAVVFHFRSGVDADVAAALQRMGAHATGPGQLSACPGLPKPPPPPRAAVLDVTTLCALVSEAANGGPASESVLAWAARVSHWQDCVVAEADSPLLEDLEPFLTECSLVTTAAALEQFTSLLERFGGPAERARWLDLRQRLEVVPCAHDSALCNQCRSVGCAVAPACALSGMSALQQGIFAAGERLKATVLTANGRAVAAAAQQGRPIYAHIHRPAWLTGL